MTHAHNHTHPAPTAVGRALTIGIVINLVYAAIECGIGLWQGSMGLVADAGHNLSDVAGLALALIAVRLAQRRASARYTFGYRKASVLISLLNALLLLAAVAGIVWECIEKFLDPQPVGGWTVAVTAAVGVAVNFFSARLLTAGRQDDLNIRGAYLHMVLDALVSVGVVVSGVAIGLTGWEIVDPIVGLIVAAVIVYSSWHLLTASLRLAVDGVPDGVDPETLRQAMLQVEGVSDIHHLHVWALSTTQNALTAHVVVGDLARSEAVRHALRETLSAHGIDHATLEVETRETEDCSCQCR